MSVFASSGSTFQPIIAEAVNEVSRQAFVGQQILPVLPSSAKKGKYVKILAANFDNDMSKPRSPGAAFAQMSQQYTSDSFECLEYGLENAMDDLEVAEASSDVQLDIASIAANALADNLMIGHELRVAAILAAASFTSNNATAVMSSVATAEPITDIQAAVLRLNGDGIFNNIKLIMEASLFQEMLQTTQLRNLINGSAWGPVWNDTGVAAVLGVSGVILCNTRYNSAASGAVGSRSKVWSDTSYYVAQVVGGPLSNGGIGRTMAYTPRGGLFTTETYRTEQPPASVVRVRMAVDELIVNAKAGQKIASA